MLTTAQPRARMSSAERLDRVANAVVLVLDRHNAMRPVPGRTCRVIAVCEDVRSGAVVELMFEARSWASVPSAARGGVIRCRIKQTARRKEQIYEIDAVLQ